MDLPTRMEEFLLLSVWKLQKDAYGLEIKQYLSDLLNQELSVGAVYVPLKRLKKRGYLETWDSEPTDERGGRSKRFFKLTGKGISALQQVKSVQEESWAGLPDIGFNWNPGKA